MFLVGRYQDHIYWYPGLGTNTYQYIIITMSLFNVIGFNKKIPFTDIGKKICICHNPISTYLVLPFLSGLSPADVFLSKPKH